MAKLTVLEMVQDILNDIDGDEVNSISDTVESEQVAQIIKSTFDAIMSNREWAHNKTLTQLTASGNSALPTHMTFNENVKEILFINYDKAASGETQRQYKEVVYKDITDFLRILNSRNNDETNIDVITDPTNVELLIRNDLHPTYYTSFDDETLVFDSYDNSVENTLTASNTQAMVRQAPTLVLADDTYPDIPAEAFTHLLEEAKSRCAIKLRQVQDVKAEQESKRQSSWLAQKSWTVNGGIKYQNYGRNRGRTYRSGKEYNQGK